SRRRHTRSKRDWSSDVCSSDLKLQAKACESMGNNRLIRISKGLRAHGAKSPDCQKTLIISLGMHEGAAAPSYLIRSGGVYAARKIGRASCRERSAMAGGAVYEI